MPVDDIETDMVVLAKHCGDYSRGIVVDTDAVTVQLMDIGYEVDVKKGKCKMHCKSYP